MKKRKLSLQELIRIKKEELLKDKEAIKKIEKRVDEKYSKSK